MGLSRRALATHAAAGWATLAIGPALAACGPAQTGGPGGTEVKFGDPVSVTFWYRQTGQEEKALQDIIGKFNASNEKNITVKGEFQGGYTEIYRKVMAAIQAGSPPDFAVAYESMVAEYMKANAVVNLDDYALKGPSAYSRDSLNDIFPAYLDSNRYDQFNGKLLSFPFAKSLAVVYHNEDLFRAAGQGKYGQAGGVWSFDEFKKATAAVTKKDSSGRTTVYGHHIRVDTSYIDAFIYANGGDLLTKDKSKVRFNEEPAIQVFDMWGEMAKDGLAYTTQGFDYQADFGQAKVAAVHESSTGRNFFRAEVKDRFKWGIGLVPQKDPAKPITVMFGPNVALFKSTPLRQAASWEFVKFFTEKDQTVYWAVNSAYMPTRKSAAEHPDLKALWEKDPQGRQAFQLTQYARPEPNIAAWQDIREILQNALTAVITGKSTAKAALDDAARQANKLIEEKQ
jgi:ABC-type glycerol-3-phosphate transport system substrate-binding protein